MFAYPDAARYRLGTNYQMLPTNAAKKPVYCPFQRDGFMNFTDNYGEDPNYVGSSLKPTYFASSSQAKGTSKSCPVQSTITEHEKWVGEVCSYTSSMEDADFEQAAGLWKVLGKDPGHQDRYVENVSGAVQGVTNKELRQKVYGMFKLQLRFMYMCANPLIKALYSRVDSKLGARIEATTEANVKAASANKT